MNRTILVLIFSAVMGGRCLAAAAVAELSLDADEAVAGKSVKGSVLLGEKCALAGGCKVALASNSDNAAVPETIVIGQGQTKGVFTITTSVDLKKTLAVKITAKAADVAQYNPAGAAGRQNIIGNYQSQINYQQGLLDGTGRDSTAERVKKDAGYRAVVQQTLSENQRALAFMQAHPECPDPACSSPLSGGAADGALKTAMLSLKPAAAAVPAKVDSLDLGANKVIQGGGKTFKATLKLGDKAASDVKVTLESDNPAAKVDKTVTIKAGQDHVDFNISIGKVDEAQKVNITATVGDKEKRVSLTLSATKVIGDNGGKPVKATLVVVGNAPSDVKASVSSDNSAAGVPSGVTIPAGKDRVDFNIAVTAVNKSQNSVITATFGSAKISATLALTPPSQFDPPAVADNAADANQFGNDLRIKVFAY